ncbi:MAG: type II toxin-antitoxin system VapC family toxin [Gammaproteobacteria bacterium]|nr:type II toxin-antitoxin system VapC family toxin [Gammaproteobacteria bacterium]
MIGLNSSVVIRYLVQDDEEQSATATRFVENSLTAASPGYINAVTLCQIVWVLERCYGVSKRQVREIIEGLLTTRQFVIENPEITWKALRIFSASNADFADVLIGHLNAHAGCDSTVTFDGNAASLPGYGLLE